jgi:hypothetical protein
MVFAERLICNTSFSHDMRTIQHQLFGILFTCLIFCSCKKTTDQTAYHDPTVEAQTQQIVQEAANGILDRYEYLPKERVARGYWDASGTWGDRDLLEKHTNFAVAFASRIFKRDTVIKTIVVQTTVATDSTGSKREKAIEDVIDRGKFLKVRWNDLPGKPLLAAYNHALTSHFVNPVIQRRIEEKGIERDILYHPN